MPDWRTASALTGMMILSVFVENNLGHWEKHEYFCYKCGNSMQMRSDGHRVCPNCETEYDPNK